MKRDPPSSQPSSPAPAAQGIEHQDGGVGWGAGAGTHPSPQARSPPSLCLCAAATSCGYHLRLFQLVPSLKGVLRIPPLLTGIVRSRTSPRGASRLPQLLQNEHSESQKSPKPPDVMVGAGASPPSRGRLSSASVPSGVLCCFGVTPGIPRRWGGAREGLSPIFSPRSQPPPASTVTSGPQVLTRCLRGLQLSPLPELSCMSPCQPKCPITVFYLWSWPHGEKYGWAPAQPSVSSAESSHAKKRD